MVFNMFNTKTLFVSGVLIGSLIISGLTTVFATTVTNPNAKYGNIDLGLKTKPEIENILTNKLAATPVSITDNGTISTTTSLQDLGVTFNNISEFVDRYFGLNVFWKTVNWNTNDTVELEYDVDLVKLENVVSGLDSYKPVVDAEVVPADTGATYVVVPSTPGITITAEQVISVASTFATTTSPITVPIQPVEPQVTDDEANVFASYLNGLTEGLVFQVGSEQVKPTVNGHLFTWKGTIGDNPQVQVDDTVVRMIAEEAAGLVNRENVPSTNIVDSTGNILHVTYAGHPERVLKDNVDIIVQKIKTQLVNSNPVVELMVEETPNQVTNIVRRIEVDLGDQKTYLIENDTVVKTYTISSGKPGTETHVGDFKVNAFVYKQDMGCTATSSYCTTDVPWVVYFNGDEAFHGTYWHNNFGTPMSHGCVNMRIEDAQELYKWAYQGMEVSVHQ